MIFDLGGATGACKYPEDGKADYSTNEQADYSAEGLFVP